MKTKDRISIEYVISVSGRPVCSVVRFSHVAPMVEDLLIRLGSGAYPSITVAKHTTEEMDIENVVAPPAADDSAEVDSNLDS